MRRHLFWMVALLLLTSWLGTRGLNADSIWIDEYWSIYNAGGAHYGPLSPGEIFQRIATEDIWHVPAYYLLVAAWGNFAGWTPAALRVMSLLFGVLSIAMVYRLGRDLHSPLAGLGAAVAVGGSAYYLYYFHELRGYTLNVLLAMIVIWAYWRVINRQGNPRWMLATFFLTTLAILYSHYLATFILMAIGAYHVLFARKDRLWWQVTGAAIVAGVLFIPWLSVTLRAWSEASSPDNVALRDWGPNALQVNALLIYIFGNGTFALPLIAGWFAVSDIKLHPQRKVLIFGLVSLIALLVFALVFNLLLALFVVMRYWLPAWGILALLVGIGVANMGKRLPAAFLAIWLISGVWNSLDPNFINQWIDTRVLSHTPWHRIAPPLTVRYQPDDLAVFLLPDETWYVWQEWVSDFYLHDVNLTLVESRRPYTSDREYRQQVAALTAPRLWLGYDTLKPPLAWYVYERTLTETYALCDAPVTTETYQLDLYVRTPENPAYTFGDQVGITLVDDLHVDNGTLAAVLGVAIGSEIDPQAYSIGLHVDDALAQDDFGLIDSPFTPYHCAVSQIKHLPAGNHTLYALVYNWQTNERLTVAGTTDDRLKLGEFEVK